MDQRTKEDALLKKLKDPDDKASDNKAISKLIDDTIHSGHKVYLGGDWHLWLREEKDKPKCHKRSDFNQILNETKNTIQPGDLFIYLGDLVDGEFQDKEELKEALLSLNIPMIMVVGNNDLFGKPFYKSCGFQYVVDSFVWGDVLFTHMPCKNDNSINVHAHIHNSMEYWVPYTNQIDVAYLGGRKKPVELMKLIHAQPAYSKKIKECPEHFNESTTMSVFEQAFNPNRIYDPYHD